ncbi:DUF938 domain-containing protein [Pannus brasiliensis CCIBt3594]|uniref:DUF938 domain-containing protein n=1 Tax=Pannus brasiliensis CCIBt3594 TaxID=1427578 RepID=A0AAW9R0G2_9CHRO
MSDLRQYAPATQRNRQPILEVLARVLPEKGNILEISSGTGEHAVFFAERLSPRLWIPSDCNSIALDSIRAWREYLRLDNPLPPLTIDVHEPVWAVEREKRPISSIVNINMIHIAPWSAGLALLSGASRVLPTDGVLYLYGPYKRSGKHTAPSNEAFDLSLRSANPEWGVRDLEAVSAAADERGFSLIEVVSMPANNLSIIFRKR